VVLVVRDRLFDPSRFVHRKGTPISERKSLKDGIRRRFFSPFGENRSPKRENTTATLLDEDPERNIDFCWQKISSENREWFAVKRKLVQLRENEDRRAFTETKTGTATKRTNSVPPCGRFSLVS
jgi:hypothetical protein